MLEQFSRWLRRYQGTEANPIYRLAVDVATGKVEYARAFDAAQSPQINGRLADGDLLELDQQVEFESRSNEEFALVLARLNAATAGAKGFEKVLVDLNLRVADLLLRDDQEAEREDYLREALIAAQRISYVNGQRRALNRLARLAFERGDTERSRDLLLQQLDAGREESDTRDEIETAILLADIALSDGDVASAHDLYHRAARSARRISYYTGAVDAILRQVAILRERDDLHGSLMLLRQASDAADHTIDTALQAEIAFRTGALLRELDQPEEAIERLSIALERARALKDLSMESRCLAMLSAPTAPGASRVVAAALSGGRRSGIPAGESDRGCAFALRDGRDAHRGWQSSRGCARADRRARDCHPDRRHRAGGERSWAARACFVRTGPRE